LEVLEVRRNLEESKHHAELEKIQQENERLLKHRQQLKEKVRSFPILLFFLHHSFSSLRIITQKKNNFD
jgi:cell division septum initiation protein DivIVA